MFCRSFRYWPSDLPIWFHISHRSCKGQRSAPRRCSTTRTIKLQDQGFFCFAVGIHRIATNLTSISQIFRFTVIESLLSSVNNGVYSRNEIVALISADHLLEFRPQGFKWWHALISLYSLSIRIVIRICVRTCDTLQIVTLQNVFNMSFNLLIFRSKDVLIPTHFTLHITLQSLLSVLSAYETCQGSSATMQRCWEVSMNAPTWCCSAASSHVKVELIEKQMKSRL